MDEAEPSVRNRELEPGSSDYNLNEREANDLDTRATLLLGIEQISSSFSVSIVYYLDYIDRILPR